MINLNSQDQQPKNISIEIASTELPVNFLPIVDNHAELEHFQKTVGQSGSNELQRSSFYRIPGQVNILRDCFQHLAPDASFNILNIGPANAQEATVIGVLARNADALDRTKIEFVDLATEDMIHPNFSLGRNFLGQAIEPPSADHGAYFFDGNNWKVAEEVQQFILNALNQASNSFGVAIENYCRDPQSERSFSLVTFNNIAQYLGRGAAVYDNPIYQKEGNFTQFQAVLLSVAERVAEGGWLFIQTTGGVSAKAIDINAIYKYLYKETNFEEVFDEIDKKAGVYRRKNNQPLIMQTSTEIDDSKNS